MVQYRTPLRHKVAYIQLFKFKTTLRNFPTLVLDTSDNKTYKKHTASHSPFGLERAPRPRFPHFGWLRIPKLTNTPLRSTQRATTAKTIAKKLNLIVKKTKTIMPHSSAALVKLPCQTPLAFGTIQSSQPSDVSLHRETEDIKARRANMYQHTTKGGDPMSSITIEGNSSGQTVTSGDAS